MDNSDSSSKSNQFKIVLLGKAMVGKSSLTIRFVQNNFSEDYLPTVMDTFRINFSIDNIVASLDTAGQDDYQSLIDVWIKDGHGFLLIYSIEDKETLQELRMYNQKIQAIKKNELVPVYIVGNKIDQVEKRKITTEEGEEFVKSLQGNVRFFETSAKTGVNCTNVFEEIVRDMRKIRDSKKDIKSTTNQQKHNKKKWKCNLI